MDKQEFEFDLNASLVLAIFLEVCPIEADILFGLHRSFGIYILTKLVMLTLILLPLGVYIYRKKRDEERTTIWSWKLMVIALIVSISLLRDSVVMVRWFGISMKEQEHARKPEPVVTVYAGSWPFGVCNEMRSAWRKQARYFGIAPERDGPC